MKSTRQDTEKLRRYRKRRCFYCLFVIIFKGLFSSRRCAHSCRCSIVYLIRRCLSSAPKTKMTKRLDDANIPDVIQTLVETLGSQTDAARQMILGEHPRPIVCHARCRNCSLRLRRRRGTPLFISLCWEHHRDAPTDR